MSEEQTKDLPGARSFEERVLTGLAGIRTEQSAIRSDIAALDGRLSTLEDRVDARLRETRPFWEAVQSALERLDEKFDNVIRDLYEVLTDIRLHA